MVRYQYLTHKSLTQKLLGPVAAVNSPVN